MFRQEHPRPHFLRESWLTINGSWEFEIENSTIKKDYLTLKEYSHKINVPFCPESRLSGIEHKDFINSCWYRRTIEVSKEQLQGRVILHFGAVDYIAKVYVNGSLAGEHKGGYVSFSFDITDLLTKGENVIVLNAWDDTKSKDIPSGKQSMRRESFFCVYTRTTGIWQSVWLEFVNNTYLDKCKIDADVDSKTITLKGKIHKAKDKQLIVKVSYEGKEVKVYKQVLIGDNFEAKIILKGELNLWQPLCSRLYDLDISIFQGDKELDKVTTYCGFRKLEIKNKCIYINDKPVFQRLVLDQGFYPEGIYTAPSKEDLLKDIETGISFGFNGARPHEKVFEERYLYYADKMGYILWGEYPNWGAYLKDKNSKALNNFLDEWEQVIERDYNHPSIIGWCPLNETYGIFGQATKECAIEIYEKTKQLDSLRPVIGSSGGFHYKTDICDIHSYTHKPEKIVPNALKCNNGIAFGFAGKIKRLISRGKFMSPKQLKELPIFLSEFGGLTYMQQGKSWGYHKAIQTEKDFLEKFEQLINNVMQCEEIFAFCYTQLTDVEQEQNGLVRYDRSNKFSDETIESISKIIKQKAKIEI